MDNQTKLQPVPYSRYRIHLTGSFSKKGFGFSYMRLAYENNITGSLFYESPKSIILDLTGMDKDILKTIIKCKKEDFIENIHILNKTSTKTKLPDFNVLNQIDE